MWLDICTLNLRNNQWRALAYSPPSPQGSLLTSTMLEDVRGDLGRYIRRLEFGLTQDYCKVIITPKVPQDSVGCRMIEAIIYQLVTRCGVVENLPTTFYFGAGKSQFQPRSLLTLSYLCTAERPRSIYDNYFYRYISANDQERAADYKKRVVEV